MALIEFITADLEKLKEVLLSIENKLYSKKIALLSGATVGQHIRHILEFYLAVVNQINTGMVNYDERRRDYELESNVIKAMEVIDSIIARIKATHEDHFVMLCANPSLNSKSVALTVSSSLHRELIYALEHSIHHQAMIKIGLRSTGVPENLIDTLGVSAATLRFRNERE